MANISKQAYQSYKHIANKKHTPHCAQRKAILNQVRSVQLSLPKPPSWQQVAASPPWAMSCRPKKIWFDQKSRQPLSQIQQCSATHHHAMTSHHQRVHAINASDSHHHHRMRASETTTTIAKRLLQCALPLCCLKHRHEHNNWHNWRTWSILTQTAVNLQNDCAASWPHADWHRCISCLYGINVSDSLCLSSRVFRYFLLYICQCSCFFLNIVIYPRVLTMSQYVSNCLKMSQFALLSNFEQFWAILSWSGRNKI